MTTRTRLLALLGTAVLAGSACTDATPDGAATTDLRSDDIVLTSALETFDSCDALLAHLVDEGVERVGPYGFGGQWWGPIALGVEETMEDDAMAEDSAESAAAPAAADEGSDGGGVSGTNNQEAGVDEADLVKTDGQVMVIAAGNTVRILDVAGGDLAERATIDLPDEVWGGELFLLDGDRALLMTTGWSPMPLLSDTTFDAATFPGVTVSRIMELDLTTASVTRTLEFEGQYRSARQIDDTVRVVLVADPAPFDFLYPSGPSTEERAEEINREIVRESTIEQWLPAYRLVEGTDGAVVTEGALTDCAQAHVPTEFAGFGTASVLTIDATSGLEPTPGVSVFTDGQTVYSSTDRLVVATPRWPEFDPETGEPVTEDDYRTALHTFDLTDPSTTSYVASGSVPGQLLNQFSLSEYEGVLRAAVTEGSPWWGTEESESSVITLDEQGDELVELGRVSGLGQGERIFAVRFLGATGYVVTFRQVDPLYVIDLSDPSAPTLEGELKIPGFSTYLHPIAEGRLLGVGQDADPETGQTTGAQLSVFDVADPANPQRLTTLGFGEYSYSAVDGDHRAFLHWPAEQLALLPISAWQPTDDGEDRNTSELVAVRLGEDDSLTEVGRIGLPVIEECEGDVLPVEPLDDADDAEAELVESSPPSDRGWCWSYQPEIRRAVIVDGTLYAVGDGGVAAASLADFTLLDTLVFER